MYASRDRRRAEPRILYWFRTPPNVRVGRAALDEEACDEAAIAPDRQERGEHGDNGEE